MSDSCIKWNFRAMCCLLFNMSQTCFTNLHLDAADSMKSSPSEHKLHLTSRRKPKRWMGYQITQAESPLDLYSTSSRCGVTNTQFRSGVEARSYWQCSLKSRHVRKIMDSNSVFSVARETLSDSSPAWIRPKRGNRKESLGFPSWFHHSPDED